MSILPPVLERKILSSLLFAEEFDSVMEEVKESEFLVADVLKQLIQQKLVTPMKLNEKNGDYEPSFMYDSDNMRAYRYRVTAEGLKFIGSR
jgi:hypothetical protein